MAVAAAAVIIPAAHGAPAVKAPISICTTATFATSIAADTAVTCVGSGGRALLHCCCCSLTAAAEHISTLSPLPSLAPHSAVATDRLAKSFGESGSAFLSLFFLIQSVQWATVCVR